MSYLLSDEMQKQISEIATLYVGVFNQVRDRIDDR